MDAFNVAKKAIGFAVGCAAKEVVSGLLKSVIKPEDNFKTKAVKSIGVVALVGAASAAAGKWAEDTVDSAKQVVDVGKRVVELKGDVKTLIKELTDEESEQTEKESDESEDP